MEKMSSNMLNKLATTYALLIILTSCSESSNSQAKESISASNVDLSNPYEIKYVALAKGEIQPRLIHHDNKTHLIYFNIEDQDSKMGNLYYKYYLDKENQWSTAIKISTRSYRSPDVIATAKLAIDSTGRVHVTWLANKPTGYMYSRSNSILTEFEPERSLVVNHLEGAEASAVIAINNNSVDISWMSAMDEKTRTVYNLKSTDGGDSFGQEQRIGDPSLGGCGCCGFASIYNNKDQLTIAYRSATNGSGRHMQLLSLSDDNTKTTQLIHPWEYQACPVSTNNFAKDKNGENWLVFETQGKIYFRNLDNSEAQPTLVNPTKNTIRQKHPSMAFNKAGYKLVIWSQGDGYFSGGDLHTQMYSPDNKVLELSLPKNMNPAAFSNGAVSSLNDDSFLVVY